VRIYSISTSHTHLVRRRNKKNTYAQWRIQGVLSPLPKPGTASPYRNCVYQELDTQFWHSKGRCEAPKVKKIAARFARNKVLSLFVASYPKIQLFISETLQILTRRPNLKPTNFCSERCKMLTLKRPTWGPNCLKIAARFARIELLASFVTFCRLAHTNETFCSERCKMLTLKRPTWGPNSRKIIDTFYLILSLRAHNCNFLFQTLQMLTLKTAT
jgi:endogenous inhibitor of DNA gyrase (YacG/DUF329 family)